MVRLMTVGEGGSEHVEGGEANVSRVHRAVGHEAELQGVREGIMKVGAKISLSAPTSLSASGMMRRTAAKWVSSTRMMSTGDLAGAGPRFGVTDSSGLER